MQLNWKVRIRNKLFWLALILAVLILVETGCGFAPDGVKGSDTWKTLITV